MAKGVKTGGRKPGTPNKVVPEVKLAAREYTARALDTLSTIMLGSESDAARVSAANALLDRGWGKPSQALTGEDGGPIQHQHDIAAEAADEFTGRVASLAARAGLVAGGAINPGESGA